MWSAKYPLLITALFLLLFVSPSLQKSLKPKAFLFPLSRDPSTHQYTVQIKQRTPLVPLNLALHLGGDSLWVNCENYGASSTYKPIPCSSRQCKLFGPYTACNRCAFNKKPRPGCNKKYTCYISITGTEQSNNGEASSDVVAVQSTNGINPGPLVSIQKFPFGCSLSSMLNRGLAKGVSGLAGFGRSSASVPSILSSAFDLPSKFAVCLSHNGVVFVGNGPYVMRQGEDVSKNLRYTRLILNPSKSPGETIPSPDYYIDVTCIKIADKKVPLSSSLLLIGRDGTGGTKIGTVERYTVLHSSIYRSLLKAFEESVAGFPRVKTVKPFGACYNASSFPSTQVGPAAPQIILEMKDGAAWFIFGLNSMVPAGDGSALCLAFVDGGAKAEAAIVIGTYQMENTLLEFDVGKSRLGISTSLVSLQTTCSNFNFTTVA